LFLACEKHIFATYLKHGESSDRQITIKYHNYKNNHGVGGSAWYNSTSLTIRLPRPRKEFTLYVCARLVAQVYLHEIGHNLGYCHKKMVSHHKLNVSWWPEELVPLKIIKEKPKPNIIEVRAARAEKCLVRWQKKLNHAKGFVKKYQTKVRYYKGKMAAQNLKYKKGQK